MAVKNKTRAEIDAEILANFIKVNNAAKAKAKTQRDKDNLYYENANRDFAAKDAKWWRDYEAKVLANSGDDWNDAAVAETLKNEELMMEADRANIAARSRYDAGETSSAMDAINAKNALRAEQEFNAKSNNQSGVLGSRSMQDMYGALRQQNQNQLNAESNNESGKLGLMNMQDMYGALRQQNQNQLNEEQLRPRLRPVVEELPSGLLNTTGETVRDGSAGEGGSISNTVNETVVNETPPPPASTPVEKPGMYESLSKTQKRMMAFAGLRDAGAALQGREGNALNNLMRDFTDRADQRRKAEAEKASRERNNLLFSTMNTNPTLKADGTLFSVPEVMANYDKIMQNMMNGAITNPALAPVMIQLSDRIKEQKEELKTDTIALQTSGSLIDAIDDILAVPNKELEVISGVGGGFKSFLAGIGVLGADANALQQAFEQVNGKLFLQAFQGLKGGGQITEKEGDAATKALVKFNSSSSAKLKKQALMELRDISLTLLQKTNLAYRGEFMLPEKIEVPDL